jgi:phosphopentomutase
MTKYFDRVTVAVMDGVGCGTPDDVKEKYPEDEGANSLVNASLVTPINAPALQRMGLEYVPGLEKLRVVEQTPHELLDGAFGSLRPTFAGKGSPEGHQAQMGLENEISYLTFDKEGFPDCVVRQVEEAAAEVLGREVKVIRYPGTDDVNGVKFIKTPGIGDVHLASKDPATGPLRLPVYASSESLVQVAGNEDVLPQDQLEAVGKAIRAAISSQILRVIIRPFRGDKPENFTRIDDGRKDYGIPPSGPTVLDHLCEQGIPVYGIGKTPDMFYERGFSPTRMEKGHDDKERSEMLIRHFSQRNNGAGLYFANFIETDMPSGHTRKPIEYVRHIEMISEQLRKLLEAMTFRDLLIVTSDHGTDPTHTAHNNHTYENVPLLVASPCITGAVNLGRRKTFTDVAATIADIFRLEEAGRPRTYGGRSFLPQLV